MKASGTSAAAITIILGCAQPARADYRAEVLADGPVGYWRLGEAAGAAQALDASGSGRHLDYTLFSGTDYGHPGAISGDPDSAVHFSPAEGADTPVGGGASTNPSVISPNSTDFAFAAGASFSVEYLIRALPGNLSTNGAGVLAKGYSTVQSMPWYLSRYSRGTVDFFLRDINNISNTVRSVSGVGDGEWHHVAGVYDAAAAEIRIFIDGALEGTLGGVPQDAYATNFEPFTLGNHFNRKFNGWLDEVAVYDKALSAGRIAAHFDAAGIVREVDDSVPLLAVDFGSAAGTGGGPGGVQTGFSEFEDSEATGLAPVTRSFASSAAAAGGQINVTVEGFTHWRDYAAVAGTYGLDQLLSDNVLRNADGTMTLTIDSLAAGTYKMTTWHVSTQFGGGSFAMSLDDSRGLNTINSAIRVGHTAELQRIEFDIVSDGTPVALVMTGGTSSQHLTLNGFTISAPGSTPPFDFTEVNLDSANRTVKFTWNSRPGETYAVEYSENLSLWIELDDSYPSGGATTTYTDANLPAAATRRYYRVLRKS